MLYCVSAGPALATRHYVLRGQEALLHLTDAPGPDLQVRIGNITRITHIRTLWAAKVI
jgi:hypothetical protein